MPIVKDEGLYVRVKGVPKITQALANIHSAVDRELALVMVDVVSKVGGTAKRLAPVDTGYLKAHIKGSVFRQRPLIIGQIKSSAPYSLPQEFGSSTNEPHPYFRPALMQNRGYIYNKLGGAVVSATMKVSNKYLVGTQRFI